MPRPKKNRYVHCIPDALYFKPRAIPLRAVDETVLAPDELEALRLADVDGLYQKEAAEKMRISRQTFGNILKSAHKKTADALLHSKAIRLEGTRRPAADCTALVCDDCAHTCEYEATAAWSEICPHCGKEQFVRCRYRAASR